MLAIQNRGLLQINNKVLINCKKRNHSFSVANDTITTPTDRNDDAGDNHQYHHHLLYEMLIYM